MRTRHPGGDGQCDYGGPGGRDDDGVPPPHAVTPFGQDAANPILLTLTTSRRLLAAVIWLGDILVVNVLQVRAASRTGGVFKPQLNRSRLTFGSL
jgi:hypothetical protein